jgi:phosphatidylglycerol lysyltransferase
MRAQGKNTDGGDRVPLILKWISPRAVIFMIFTMGAYLLLSATVPAEAQRLKFLKDLVPLEVIEASHFASSLAGLLLILLARALQKRLDSAWALTVFFLFLSSLLALLKGLRYEEAIFLGILCAILLANRKYFRRRGSLLVESFSSSGMLALTAILAAFLGLGHFHYHNVAYSDELWWRFALNSDAPRFLRATGGISVLLLILIAARLLQPATVRFLAPQETDLEDVRKVILSGARCSAWLAMLRDKSFLFNASRTAFVMHRSFGRSWIALGDPVGPIETWKDLILRFRREADLYGGWAVFHETSSAGLPIYLDAGLQILKIGEEARVDLAAFSLEGSPFRDLRQARKKSEEKHHNFIILDPPHSPKRFQELRTVSDAWLRDRHVREKMFSLGSFDEKYLADFPIAAVMAGDKIVAFANILPDTGRGEFSADLMRYIPDPLHGGMMDYLFVSLLLWGKERGYRWFNMGMAPLSGIEDNEFSPLWQRVGGLVYRHGENFYNFKGLRAYKEKFKPVWEPRYLVFSEGAPVPAVFAHISALTAGGWMGIFRK